MIHRLRKWTYGCQREGGREGIDREFRTDMYMRLYLKWVTNRTCYIARNFSVLCGSLDGTAVWGRMDTCICETKSFHCSPETIIILWTGYTQIENKKVKKNKNKYNLWFLFWLLNLKRKLGSYSFHLLWISHNKVAIYIHNKGLIFKCLFKSLSII